jgi:hypothetical protein
MILLILLGFTTTVRAGGINVLPEGSDDLETAGSGINPPFTVFSDSNAIAGLQSGHNLEDNEVETDYAFNWGTDPAAGIGGSGSMTLSGVSGVWNDQYAATIVFTLDTETQLVMTDQFTAPQQVYYPDSQGRGLHQFSASQSLTLTREPSLNEASNFYTTTPTAPQNITSTTPVDLGPGTYSLSVLTHIAYEGWPPDSYTTTFAYSLDPTTPVPAPGVFVSAGVLLALAFRRRLTMFLAGPMSELLCNGKGDHVLFEFSIICARPSRLGWKMTRKSAGIHEMRHQLR